MAKLVSAFNREKIISLRMQGYSINEIKKIVPAGKGTISRYVQGIVVPPPYDKILKDKRNFNTKRKEIALENALEEAEDLVSGLSEKEKLLFMCALYWAEGSKRDFSITNTDSNLIETFIWGLKNILKVDSKNIQVSVRVYEDLDIEQCKIFWARITGIQIDQFQAIHVLKGKKIGKLKYGMCRVRVRKGSKLLKLVAAVNTRVTQQFSYVGV